ncbi:xanthine dehydrogenase family protein molybdopterin-binding subunit [Paraburkholderia sp. 22B1P]|uniref:xanthine dehydrogenase family protein molybdopterin-binding subunit n=1 Tax=Paraburkholderia sp. 22B1P TaxID=3080498 RepID=UPI0030856480|nr:xanthine dehydrogenase family protein molybdopterin-binding subunit [Paraburkholderia sp. 22B1P]
MNDQAVGVATPRIDGRLKVTGAARYAADQQRPGMTYGYGVFSNVASGRILGIDTRDAERTPGVIAVLHHANFPRLYRAPKDPITLDGILSATIMDERRLPFEDANVNYAGQFVALVIADSFEHAREAAFKVNVQYAKNRAVANLDQGVQRGGTREGGAGHSRGSVEPAFAAAPYKVDATYRTPVETHNPMEMHSTVAWWDDDGLHVFEASQGVTMHRNTLARIFDMPTERVTVQAPFIGSGFGSKLWVWPHSIAACAAAKVVGRPVKLVVPRAQMFSTTGHRPETEQHVRLGADANGKLLAVAHESINTTSFTDDFTERCGTVSRNLYSCANVLVTHRTTQVSRGSPTSMRAPGAAPGLFALESAVDELALQLGVDPLEFRIRNFADLDESQNLPWSSNHLREACEKGAAAFGWNRRDPRVGSMRDGAEIIGYGMAACNWDAFRVPAEARVALMDNGTVRVNCAIQDIGTGTYTIVAQTVADMTGIPLQRIQVNLGDSSFPAAPVSGGSWATASVLPAVAEACRAAIAQVKAFATADGGVWAGTKADGVGFSNGKLTAGARSVDYVAVLKAQRIASAQGYAHTGLAPTDKYSFGSFGVHFVEVRWDPGISRLRVSRVVSAIDAGRAINPLTARNQVEGAIVMGVGMALFENAQYDERNGMPTNNNYAEYVVPVHADQPDVDVILLDYPDYHLNEFGARGIGEIGVTGLAAAVANAVHHATGRRVRDLPITLDKLIQT